MHKTKTTTRQIETHYRNFEIRAVSEENRTVELSFSSEEPYERYWGIEVLDHSPTSVNLSRLNNAAPLLLDHDTRNQIGVVESAAISSERKGVATVRFSRSERGDEVFKDVVDGIRKNVSVGYQIEEMLLESRDGDTETYRVTKWMPFEVSIVSVPADTSVGVGRSHDESRANVTMQAVVTVWVEDEESKEEEDEMIEEEKAAAAELAKKALEVKTETRSNDAGEILVLGERFGQRDAAVEAVKSGVALEAFRVQVMDRIETKQKDTRVEANTGDFLTEKEKEAYSLVRALRDAAAGKKDTFEFRVGEEAAKRQGINANGLYVPSDMLMRTMSVADTTYGGNTVQTEVMGGNFIDALTAQSVLMQICMRLDGLVGNVDIPRMSSGSVVYNPAEKVAITVGDVGTDLVSLRPVRYGASVPMTKQLLMQSSVAVEAMIRNDIARQIALKIESNAIAKILAATGVSIVALGAAGAVPTNQAMIDMETAVTAANAAMGNLKYLINAKGRGKLKSTVKVSGFPSYIMENNEINGYEALMTNLVPSDLTKSTGSALSAAIFGNFDDLIIGTWGGLDIVVDPFTQAKEGIINITADQLADSNVRHGASFAAIKDMITV